MNKKEIGLMLRRTLKERDIFVREFCRETGINMPQLYRIFNGENYTMDKLLRVLDALDLEISIIEKEEN